MTSTVRSESSTWDAGGEPLPPEVFKAIFRRHPAGVAVITGWVGERPFGFSATSVISVSAEPPIVAFSVQSESSSWPGLAAADSVAISLLSAGQADLSARFATRGIDRFGAGGWHRLPTGEPVITDAVSWLRGTVLERVRIGGSYLVAVRVVAAGGSVDGGAASGAAGAAAGGPVEADPLVYLDRAYHRLDGSTAL